MFFRFSRLSVFRNHMAVAILGLLIIAMPTLAQDAAVSSPIDHHTKAATWPTAEQADVIELSSATTARELRMPFASGAKFIPSMPHGRYMLVTPGYAGSKGMGSIYDLHKRMLYRKMPNMTVSGKVILSPEGTRLAAENKDSTGNKIVIATIIPPRPIASITLANNNPVQWMAFADDNTLLVMGDGNGHKGELTAYDTNTTKPLWQLEDLDDLRSRRWAMTPKGKHVALVYEAGNHANARVALHDTHTGKRVGEIEINYPDDAVARLNGIAFSATGERLALYFQPSRHEPYVLLLDAKTGQPVDRLKVGELPSNLKYRHSAENELAFIDEDVLLVKDELVLLRGFSQAVDALPASMEEQRMALRTTGRAEVLRIMKQGANGFLVLEPIDLTKLTEIAQKKEEAFAAANQKKEAERLEAAQAQAARLAANEKAAADRELARKEAALALANQREAKRIEDAQTHARLLVERALPVRVLVQPDLGRPLRQGKPQFSGAMQWQVPLDPADASASQRMSEPVALLDASRERRVMIADSGRVFVTLPSRESSRLGNRALRPDELPPEPALLTYYDTATGKGELLKDLKIDATGELLALSHEGDRCAIQVGGRMEIYDLPRGDFLVGFEVPNDDGSTEKSSYYTSSDLRQAHFIAKNMLLTATRKYVNAWIISNDKVTLRWSIETRAVNILPTPGGRYLLLQYEQYDLMVDAHTGEVKGVLSVSKPGEGTLSQKCFTPDGSRLIATRRKQGHTVLLELDMKTGRWVSQTPIGNMHTQTMQCLGDQWLLIGEMLVDRKTGAPLWHYRGATQLFAQSTSPMLRYWVRDTKTKQAAVLAVNLPEAAIAGQLVTPASYGPLFGPGSTVALEATMRPEAIKEMKRNYKARGIEVVPHSPFRLQGTIKTESQGEQQYRITSAESGFTPTPDELAKGKVVTIEQFTTTRTLKLIDGEGKTLWQTLTRASTGDRAVLRTADHDPAAALSVRERNMRTDDFSEFVNMLPEFIYPSVDSALLGSSQLGLQGSVPATASTTSP